MSTVCVPISLPWKPEQTPPPSFPREATGHAICFPLVFGAPFIFSSLNFVLMVLRILQQISGQEVSIKSFLF